MDRKQRIVPAGEFRAKCLALLNDVRDQHEEIVVTKRGKPVAKLVPIERPPIPDLRHLLTGPIGDVESPVEVAWESLAGTILWEADDIITPFDDEWEANQ